MEIYIFIHFQQGRVYSARKHHYYMIDSWYLLAKFKMTTCTMHLFPCSCYPPSCQLDKVPTVELRQKSNRPQYVLSIHFSSHLSSIECSLRKLNIDSKCNLPTYRFDRNWITESSLACLAHILLIRGRVSKSFEVFLARRKNSTANR